VRTGNGKLGVGVIGAHTWAEKAHLPGYVAHENVDLVALCDIDIARAQTLGKRFGARRVYNDHRALLADPEVQMVDVCTPTYTHLPLSLDVIAAGRHVLSEKPLAPTAAPAFDAAKRARAKGVRTKLGFTFRYSPAIRQLREWILDGTLGEIFHIHGFEQNSQFLDPDFPLRQTPPDAPTNALIPGSIIGYGSHLVDLMRWLGGEFKSVASTMSNFVPVGSISTSLAKFRRAPISRPVAPSHRRMFLWVDEVTTLFPSGVIATLVSRSECPRSVAILRPVTPSHVIAVLSHEAVTIRCPSACPFWRMLKPAVKREVCAVKVLVASPCPAGLFRFTVAPRRYSPV